jgi:ligand-binding sensor domain-containing protein
VPTLVFGQTYTLYTSGNSDLPHNQVYCIAFDNDGNIWFGGQEDGLGFASVSMLSSDYSAWTVYDPQDADLGLTNLEDRVFYMAIDDQNNKWFCTHYGVSYQLADGTPGEVGFTVDAYTRSVQADDDGNVYISIREDDRDSSRVWISDDYGTSWDTQWFLPDLGYSLGPADARPEIYDLHKDSQDQLWVCTWYGVSFRNTSNVWYSFPEIEGEYTYCMTIDNNDHAWVPDAGSYDLYELAADQSVTTHDSNEVDILRYPINDIEADWDGYLWLATDGGGLIRMAGDLSGYTQYNVSTTSGQIPQDNITHMEIYNNVVWISTADSGIVRVDGVISSIDNGDISNTPTHFELSQNYPNPFNPSTSITFTLDQPGYASVQVFNSLGQLVTTLADGSYKAGSHTLRWDGLDAGGNQVASGIYLYRLNAGSKVQVRKMILMK